jgi:hypothetical protein
MLSFNTMANIFPSLPTSSGLTSDSFRYGETSRPGSRGSQLASATQYFSERKRYLSRGLSKQALSGNEHNYGENCTYSEAVTRQSPTPAQGPPFRDSSFPPLETRSSCPTTPAKRPKTLLSRPKTPVSRPNTLLVRTPTPFPHENVPNLGPQIIASYADPQVTSHFAASYERMGLPHITITEPNLGTNIGLYPDLPTYEQTQIPQFRLGPQVNLPSPPNMRYTGAHVPMKPLPGQPGKFHYGTLTHRTQLQLLWLKFAHKRLQKELDEANYEHWLPDFHYALKRACDLSKIQIKDLDIRKIRIPPDVNMAKNSVLVSIWQKILIIPSVIPPDHANTSLDLVDSFVPQNGQTIMITSPKGAILHPIHWLKDQKVDKLYIKATWHQHYLEFLFQDFLNKSGLLEFLEKNEATLETPESFNAIKNEDFKVKLKESWETQFNKTGVSFNQWLPTINSLIQIVETVEQIPLKEDAEVQHGQIPSSSSEDKTQSAQPTDRMLEAYKSLGLAPTEDQKILNNLLSQWNMEQTDVSIPQFAYNCRNKKAVLSDELNSLFKNMDIHSDNESEETELDDHSGQITIPFIPPYSSANLEDVLHKTEDEWNGYLARMIILLPQGENIISNQTLMATANYIDPIRDGLLASITAKDFLPKGRFLEFHIPRYIHIPTEIQDKLQFHGYKGHCAFYCVWRCLYQARHPAQEILVHNTE